MSSASAHDVFVIGTVANFGPEKDYPNLLRAVRGVDRPGHGRCCPSHRCLGKVRTRPTTAQLVDELDLSASVTLTGFRPDAPRSDQQPLHASALASRWEGLPVAIMEVDGTRPPDRRHGRRRHGRALQRRSPTGVFWFRWLDSSALADALDPNRARPKPADSPLAAGSRGLALEFDGAAVHYPHRSLPIARSPHHAVPGPPVLGSARRPERLSPRLRSGSYIRPATADDRVSILEQLCRTQPPFGVYRGSADRGLPG